MLTPAEWVELEHEREDDARRDAINEDLHDERDEPEELPPVFDWEFM